MCTSQTLLAESQPEEEEKTFGGIIAELIDEADTSPELGYICEACGIGAHGGCGDKKINSRGNLQCCCRQKEWPKEK